MSALSVSPGNIFKIKKKSGKSNKIYKIHACFRRLSKSRIGTPKHQTRTGGDRPVRHDHYDHLHFVGLHQGLELVLPVEQDGLQRQLDPIVAELLQRRHRRIQGPMGRLSRSKL